GATAHEEQADVVLMVERLAAADVEGELPLLGDGSDAIGVLQVVELRIELDAVIDFVAGDEATAPAAGDELIAEPVADFAVEIDGTEFGRHFHREVVLR